MSLLLVMLLALPQHLLAGGPILVVGIPPDWNAGVSGQFWRWNTASPVSYRTDGGSLGLDSNAAAISRVQTMFQAWQDVTTASIRYQSGGSIPNTTNAVGTFNDSNVSTANEFNVVEEACFATDYSPIIFDADGTLFTALGEDPDVIGFAGPCAADANGIILSGRAALNGKWIDGNNANGELASSEFNGTFIHEFGHFSGLDHSQVNVNCLTVGCADGAEDTFGLPTMFPFVVSDSGGDVDSTLEEAQDVAAVSTLAEDDISMISRIYPETVNNPGNGQVPFNTVYGTISGLVLFPDGESHAQGYNVIAREVDDGGTAGVDESRRNAVSGVSGVRFTTSIGQGVTGDNPSGDTFYGSRDALLVGAFEIAVRAGRTYNLQVEELDPSFTGGSSVNPFSPPFPLGANESPPASPVSSGNVVANTTVNVNLVLQGTDPRFDQFEGP